jgi:hypothetical protein
MGVTFTSIFSPTTETSLFRGTHHTAPVIETFSYFFSPPVELSVGFNHDNKYGASIANALHRPILNFSFLLSWDSCFDGQ